MIPLLLALALADPLPPQNQPVNITQVSGTPVSGSVPVTCVSGCGGGSGGSSGGGGGGAAWDGGVIVQYPVAIASLWDGGVLVQNFPASFGSSQVGNWSVEMVYDGGAIPVSIVGGNGTGWDAGVLVQNPVNVMQDSFPWSVLAPPDWDAGVIILEPVAIASLWDGGVEVQNFPTSFGATQSGNWATLMIYDGGALPITGNVSVTFPTIQAVSLVDSGIPAPYDAGYLAYSYAGPLPADTSYQTSCTNGIVFCGTTSTALTACSGGKWQDFQNQSSQSIYICAQAGCSAPTAIDAGTVVGEAVPPMATYFANGSAQYWCVVPTSAQNSPDAGTVTKCCK